MTIQIIIGLLIPFFGTVLGASTVFLMKNKINKNIEKILLGLASGVMIAASIWSLLIPAIDMSSNLNKLAFFPALVGFMFGTIFLLFLDKLTTHLHINTNKPVKIKSNLGNTAMMVFAITLHNIPEGMAVGVAFASALLENQFLNFASAFALAVGIAIQNFPEGAIISMPLKSNGISKQKSFLYGVLSGIVEPIGAIITILLTNFIVPILPYILAFAAGAMIYVVTKELIPKSQDDNCSDFGVIGTAIGFAIMMVLDISLG